MLQEKTNQFEIIDRKVTINGLETIEVSGRADDAATLTIWVCPARNFLPVKVRCKFDNRDDKVPEYVMSDFIELPNGMYFSE